MKYSQESFILKAKETHGDKYDYSNSVYTSSKIDISITCKEHGEFKQRPSRHISGSNCPECAKIAGISKIIITTEEFISRAIEKHGNKYDYSKSVCTSGKDKIKIICPNHGEFSQTAGQHLRGSNCPQCVLEDSAKNQTYTTDEYIKKARKIHNNKYSYDKTVYTGKDNKVVVTCPEHGDFEIVATSHIRKRACGCTKCSFIKNSEIQTYTNEEFITKANLIHNNRYNYSKSEYINSKIKTIIICSIHGDFEINPSVHLRGGNCPSCAKASGDSINRKNHEDFVEQANKVHNNEYVYEDQYTGANNNIKIFCQQHGYFEQRASSHLKGTRCPECRAYKGEKVIRKILNGLNISYKSEYKFEDLVYKKQLRFDFVIFNEDKISGIIEFDGDQHHRPVSFGSKNKEKVLKNFEDIQIRDKLKEEYCLKNGYKLLKIKYKALLDNEVEELVTDFVKAILYIKE